MTTVVAEWPTLSMILPACGAGVPFDKAAVLACRIAWKHPLPDGNKRAAWACLELFIDLDDGSWNDEQPDTVDAVEATLAVAAREVDETWLASWFVTGSSSEPEPRCHPVSPNEAAGDERASGTLGEVGDRRGR